MLLQVSIETKKKGNSDQSFVLYIYVNPIPEMEKLKMPNNSFHHESETLWIMVAFPS